MFNKGDMIGVEYLTRSRVPKAISFSMRSIANQDTRNRAL
jgi:hypothetical protein